MNALTGVAFVHILPFMVDPQLTALEQRAADANVPMADILQAAGVARTTWTRWKRSDFDPRLSTLRKLHAALDEKLRADAA